MELNVLVVVVIIVILVIVAISSRPSNPSSTRPLVASQPLAEISTSSSILTSSSISTTTLPETTLSQSIDFNVKHSKNLIKQLYQKGLLPKPSSNKTIQEYVKTLNLLPQTVSFLMDVLDKYSSINLTPDTTNELYLKYSNMRNIEECIDYDKLSDKIGFHKWCQTHCVRLLTGAYKHFKDQNKSLAYSSTISQNLYDMGGITDEIKFTQYFNTPLDNSSIFDTMSTANSILPTSKIILMKNAFNLFQISGLMHMYILTSYGSTLSKWDPSFTAYQNDPMWIKIQNGNFLSSKWKLMNTVGLMAQYSDGTMSLMGIMGIFNDKVVIVFRPSHLSQDWIANFGLGESVNFS